MDTANLQEALDFVTGAWINPVTGNRYTFGHSSGKYALQILQAGSGTAIPIACTLSFKCSWKTRHTKYS